MGFLLLLCFLPDDGLLSQDAASIRMVQLLIRAVRRRILLSFQIEPRAWVNAPQDNEASGNLPGVIIGVPMEGPCCAGVECRCAADARLPRRGGSAEVAAAHLHVCADTLRAQRARSLSLLSTAPACLPNSLIPICPCLFIPAYL